jgi:hypothetical protein
MKLPKGKWTNEDLRAIASDPKKYTREMSMQARIELKSRVAKGKAKFVTKLKQRNPFTYPWER